MSDRTVDRAYAWRVDYDNDVGDDDGGFWEWWEVTNGTVAYKADKETEAKSLCNLLNASPPRPESDEVARLRNRVAELESGLAHISYYWNGDRNDVAMSDALGFITREADRLLKGDSQ